MIAPWNWSDRRLNVLPSGRFQNTEHGDATGLETLTAGTDMEEVPELIKPSAKSCRRVRAFDAAHRPVPAFRPAVVLFNTADGTYPQGESSNETAGISSTGPAGQRTMNDRTLRGACILGSLNQEVSDEVHCSRPVSGFR